MSELDAPREFNPSQTRWAQIDSLLNQVLEMPKDQQVPFVGNACKDDPELLQEMLALIKAEHSTPSVLKQPVLEFATTLLGELLEDVDSISEIDVPGHVIEEKIGGGGMGVVYRARHTTLNRQVALKVMRDVADDPFLLHRFQLEQRVLSRLDHPFIAHLYEAGMTRSGRPYFSMEYVEGTPLLTYCDAHTLSLEERLLKFIVIAEAVHYAHRNLVVHRDLKPSNLLATTEGEPRLLDFGIAKLLEEEDAGHPKTRTGERLMTPMYAAPEQIKGQTISTATDIYQLGVLLYELLTGRLPYPTEGRSQFEIESAVCNLEPVRPSEIVRNPAEVKSATSIEVARARNSSPERLSRTLRGDLDAILLKALRKEPDARYLSVEDFVEDVKRFLAGLSVDARKGSTMYRTGKFLRRHAVAAAFSVVLMLTMVTAAALMFSQYKETTFQANRSEQALDFMDNLLVKLSPEALGNDTLTVRQFMEMSRDQMSAYSGDSLDRAFLLDRFGKIHHSLGLYDEAYELLNEALNIRESRLDEYHPELADSYYNLATTLFYLREFDRSMPMAERAYQVRLHNAGTHQDTLVLESLEVYAYNFYNIKNNVAADSLYQLAYDACEDAPASFDSICGVMYSGYSTVKEALGDMETAEELLLRALSLVDRNTIAEANKQRNLGMLYEKMGRLNDALNLFEQSIATYSAVLGDSVDMVGSTYYNAGRILVKMNNSTEAKAYFQNAIRVFDSTPVVVAWEAYPRVTLAKILLEEGNGLEAEVFLLEARSIYLANDENPQSSRLLASVNDYLGQALSLQSRFEEAVVFFQASYGVYSDSNQERANRIHSDIEKIQRNL